MPPTILSWHLTPEGHLTEGTIPFTDRGLRYGMSIFETIAWTGRKLLFLAEHLAALQQAALAADFPAISTSAAGRLAALATELPATPGMLRIYLTAGDGAPLAPVTQPRLFALYEDTAFPTPGEYEQGWHLCTYTAPLPCILGGWKTGNYWPHIQALAHARHERCHEALVFNAAGALVSASMANIFLIHDGHLRTPALMTGARPGVVRSWVLSTTPVEEALLTPEDIATADECFLTNSRLGLMPVRSIDGRVLSLCGESQSLLVAYLQKIS